MLTNEKHRELPPYTHLLKLVPDANHHHVRWDDLGTGERNQVWRVRFDDKDLVMRIPKETPRRRGFYGAEFYNQNCAFEMGLAPRIWAEDVTLGFVMSDFVCGPSVEKADFESEQFCDELATALRRLHESGHWFLYRNDLLEITYTRLKTQLTAHVVMLPGTLYRISLVAEKCRRLLLRQPRRLCPVHGDLALRNIIRTPHGIRFIDWEAAGMGDRLNELAFVIFSSRMNPSSARAFLALYFQGETRATQDLAIAKVFLHWLLHVYRWAVEHDLLAAQAGCPNPAQEKSRRDARIDEFMSLLKSQVIRDSVRVLGFSG